MPAPTVVTPGQTLRIEALTQVRELYSIADDPEPPDIETFIQDASKVADFIENNAVPLVLPTAENNDGYPPLLVDLPEAVGDPS